MNFRKECLGLKPKKVLDKVFLPSRYERMTSKKWKTKDEKTKLVENKPKISRKILIIGTENSQLRMTNGKFFLTGNHPTELFVPMLCLDKAGFGFDFGTINGNPIQLENWTIPLEDEELMDMYERYVSKISSPLKLNDLADHMFQFSDYSGILIPGGYGVLADLPQSLAVKKIVMWALKNDVPIIVLSHGSAALLATTINEEKDYFPFTGYKMAVFPDSISKVMHALGYLPGKLPFFLGKELEEKGVHVVNTRSMGRVVVDRNLISGDGPKAAKAVGKLAVHNIIQRLN